MFGVMPLLDLLISVRSVMSANTKLPALLIINK